MGSAVSKTMSLVLCATYLTVAAVYGDGAASMRLGLFLLLPMACIWFSDEMGAYTGMLNSPAITQESPGCLIAFVGWVLLLLPVVVVLIVAVRT